MRRLAPLALLVAAAGLACAKPRPPLRPSPLAGKPVEIVAEDLRGREIRLGPDPARVRIVDFWATWCEPCRDQLPVLEALHQRYADQGLTVVGVSFDEDRAQVDRFLADVPVTFLVLWDKGGARLAEPLDVQRLPTTLLLDRRGRVRHVHLGFRPEEAAKLEAEVVRLLGEALSPE